jgi:hypothetical protein
LFKARLKNIEKVLARQNTRHLDDQDSTFNLNDELERCRLDDEKTLISSLLITPKLKKTKSYSVCTKQKIHEPNLSSKKRSDSSLHEKLIKHSHCMNLVERDVDEDNCEKCEKLSHHGRVRFNSDSSSSCSSNNSSSNSSPNIQDGNFNSRTIVESLRLNLKDIEAMTANNIIKLASLKN